MRIYFSNRPTIDLKLQTQILGLEANFAFLKQKIVDALTAVISGQAVLPNRFCMVMGDGMSVIDLKSPMPQGVLRLVVLEAKELHAAWRRVLFVEDLPSISSRLGI